MRSIASPKAPNSLYLVSSQVETIGDSYVAVTGLPEPQPEHAVIMTRFARDCKVKMNEVTRKLEMTLGPGTQELQMRFGLHSGPVTAGVLRGEKSRFQLFGDTGTLYSFAVTHSAVA